MNEHTITREFWFSAAHRVEGHPKCGRLHGHNYRVVIALAGHLDPNGMVLDFGELDSIAKPLIDEMDHRYIISKANVIAEDKYAVIAMEKQEAYVVECEQSTAELLAKHIHTRVSNALQWPKEWMSVYVQETPRNEAMYGG